MYFVGKSLFDRQTAFIAALLYQVLPVCTQVTSDGLSDSLFLLMTAMALWFGVIALRTALLAGSPGRGCSQAWRTWHGQKVWSSYWHLG